MKPQGLCFRCEHRARFLEKGTAHRVQCSDTDKQVSACYMYEPCRPVVLEIEPFEKDDPRPWPATGYFARRSCAVRLADETDVHLGVCLWDQSTSAKAMFLWEKNDETNT